MTIDETIAHEREVAKEIYVEAMLCHANPDDGELDDCVQHGKYHEQLAEWLEELKDYRDKNKMVVRVDCENMDHVKDKIEELSRYTENQYNKGIDDAKSVILQTLDNEILVDTLYLRLEQLRAGGKDEQKRQNN